MRAYFSLSTIACAILALAGLGFKLGFSSGSSFIPHVAAAPVPAEPYDIVNHNVNPFKYTEK